MLFSSSFNVFFLLPLTIFAAPLVVTTTTSTTYSLFCSFISLPTHNLHRIPGATYNLTLVGKTGGAVDSSNPNDDEIVFPQVSLREQSPDSVVYDITNGWRTSKEDKEVPATALFLSPSDYEKRVADSVRFTYLCGVLLTKILYRLQFNFLRMARIRKMRHVGSSTQLQIPRLDETRRKLLNHVGIVIHFFSKAKIP